MDYASLARAIGARDMVALRWYVEHADETQIISELDAEARLAYFRGQLQLQPVVHDTSHGVADAGALIPLSLSHPVAGSRVLLPHHRLAAGHTAPSLREAMSSGGGDGWDRANSAAANAAQHPTQPLQQDAAVRDHLPLKLHRTPNRKLFRSYASLLPAGSGDAAAVASWDAAPDDLRHLSPKADTSTFLLQRVDTMTTHQSGSPRSRTVHRRQVELHEDEERVDLVQLEEYEWTVLLSLHRDHWVHSMRRTCDRQRADLAAQESTARLRVSQLQWELWTAFLQSFASWRDGEAKPQNTLLMNEAYRRSRVEQDEAAQRNVIVEVHRKEAIHQLAELRRLRALEREHMRAVVMHRSLAAALQLQGIATDIGPDSTENGQAGGAKQLVEDALPYHPRQKADARHLSLHDVMVGSSGTAEPWKSTRRPPRDGGAPGTTSSRSSLPSRVGSAVPPMDGLFRSSFSSVDRPPHRNAAGDCAVS